MCVRGNGLAGEGEEDLVEVGKLERELGNLVERACMRVAGGDLGDRGYVIALGIRSITTSN